MAHQPFPLPRAPALAGLAELAVDAVEQVLEGELDELIEGVSSWAASQAESAAAEVSG